MANDFVKEERKMTETYDQLWRRNIPGETHFKYTDGE